MKKSIFAALVALLAGAATNALADAHAFVKAQGRGVNLGNMLEAPGEGQWGIVLKKEDLALIASKGFTNVRIPIRWDGLGVGDSTFERALRTAPYTVEPRFFERVDSAISWARQSGLMVVLNDHHHDSLFHNFEHERPRFIAIWKQIAERYKGLSDSVGFEILNEPNTQVTIEAWNSLLDTTLKVIRQTNPTRAVVVGTANWGGLSGLSGLKLPEGDKNLILTIHYYEPFAFTHQGAEWVTPIPTLGVKWEGTYYEKLAVKQAMDAIADYAKARDIPVWIGEFGAYSKADIASRARWSAYCARLFESYGFSWSYWEFKAGFGIYNETNKTWNSSLVEALTSNDNSVLALGEPPVGGTDLVQNGGFATKTKWSLNASQGTAFFRIDSGSGLVEISDPATDAWGIQLIQAPVRVTKGLTHVLQFDAWASSPRSIDGGIGMSVSPWTGYVSAAAGLTSTRKTFFASFVPAKTDSLARISFNLGPDTGNIHIDNVKLLVWDTATASIAAPIRAMAGLSWSKGVLRSRHAVRPGLEAVLDLRGAKVASLVWRREGSGWSAAAPNLTTGTWILQGSAGVVHLVVTR